MSGVIAAIWSRVAYTITCLVVGIPLSHAEVPDLSTHSLMSRMTPEERYSFVAGIVEGIAFHRYTIGEKDKVGMECIYNWFYEGHNGQRTIDVIYAAFGKYPDYPPAAVVAALANRKCAE